MGIKGIGPRFRPQRKWTRINSIQMRLQKEFTTGSFCRRAGNHIGLFNLLQHGPFAVLAGKPVTAKIFSVAVAMIVTWIGNRLWTFADQRTRTKVREFVGFVVVNIGGMAIAVLCLWISRYVLGFDSPLADNISANVIGLVLGMIFRYLAYKYLVFTGDKPPLDPRSTHL